MKILSIKNGDYTEIHQCENKKNALEWCDNLLDTVNNYSLFTELNNIQIEIDTEKNPAFAVKSNFPLCIINLLLNKFNLILVPDSKDSKENGL